MTQDEAINLVKRYAKLHRKDKNYYAFDYALEHTIDENGKKKYVRQPWFVDQTITDETYYGHLKKEKYRSWGLILPPTTEKNEASFGALDKDIYGDEEDNKRIVKQIYDEKLPLVPCYSKSKGLHIYMYCKDDVPAGKIRSTLQHYNKYLGINCKEVNPKQTKLKWNKQKKRFDPGNGILLPYMNCLEQKGTEISHTECLNQWIKNADLETGNLEEFLNYAESVSIDKNFFGEQPLELEEKPEENKPIIHSEERDFAESNARPLSKPLRIILKNIKNKVEHDKGGKFDWWLVDFVYGAMEEKRSDLDIQKHLKRLEDKKAEKGTYDKDWDTYIQDKINNCREKFDKADPGPQREKFMHDIIYIKKLKKFFDKSTKNAYDKETVDTTYAHVFPKKSPPTTYFKEHPNKQLAEEEVYRPDLYNGEDPLIKGADELYYVNNYKPSKIKPIKPEKVKDLEPFFELMEHLVIEVKEREHLLDILGYIVQNPWKKVKTITVIYTEKQRFGKGTLFDTLVDIKGETNCEPTDVKQILDKGVTFAEKELILVDEVKSKGDFTERSNLINDLKKIGTETRIQQRRLFVDYKVIETQTNYLIFTNNSDALNIEAEDERYFVIANENERKPQSWYKKYHKWRQDKGSSYVYWFLKNRDISKFDPMAPPPMTEAKKEMEKETGHPLTLKLREWIKEGRHPFNLDECVRGTTELAEYISKQDRGDHVRYANNKKTLNKCLKECGCVFIGQVHHKLRNEKPTLFLYRNQKEMLEKHKKSELCNHIWKPLRSESREAVVSERQNENFNNMDTTESDRAFEHNHLGHKKKDERETICWSCHESIDTDGNEKCVECNWGIKCACGKCTCDDPKSKVRKKGAYA
jgi:hypothetical protein